MQRFAHRCGLLCLSLAGRLPARRKIGAALGLLALLCMRSRRRIAGINLRLTHPQLSSEQRRRLRRRHFIALGQWMMDNLWALTASRREIKNYVRLEGDAPPSCLLLVPHFLGLEPMLLRLDLHMPAPPAYYYKPMHSGFWNAVLLHLRQRFGSVGFSTDSRYSLLPVVRHCRNGGALCYLPDIDPRMRKSTVYVPFMGVAQAATTTSVARLAAAANLPVVPCIVCRTAEGYRCRLLPPLENFPSGDEVADARRVNALVEEWVREMPENYFWLHRRFKTDAQGATGLYGR